jgi:hypothetical protein
MDQRFDPFDQRIAGINVDAGIGIAHRLLPSIPEDHGSDFRGLKGRPASKLWRRSNASGGRNRAVDCRLGNSGRECHF